jgi:hypothetical protein
MIQGYRLAGKGFPPKAVEWGPSCIGYFAADVGYGSNCEELEPSIFGPLLPSKADVRADVPVSRDVPFPDINTRRERPAETGPPPP